MIECKSFYYFCSFLPVTLKQAGFSKLHWPLLSQAKSAGPTSSYPKLHEYLTLV